MLRRIPARRLHLLLRPWLTSWRPADVLWALEYGPSGGNWRFSDRVRVPERWLLYRLSAWLDEAGQPFPPHSAELAQRAVRDRAQRWTAPPPRPPQVAVTGAALARELLRSSHGEPQAPTPGSRYA